MNAPFSDRVCHCVLLQDVYMETQDSGAISIHGDSFQTENNRTCNINVDTWYHLITLLVGGKECNENLHPLKNMLYS